MSLAARSRLRLACFALIGAVAVAGRARATAPSEISAGEALAQEKAGAELPFVDVRTPEEFAAGLSIEK